MLLLMQNMAWTVYAFPHYNQIYDVKDYISRLLEQLLFPELPHYL